MGRSKSNLKRPRLRVITPALLAIALVASLSLTGVSAAATDTWTALGGHVNTANTCCTASAVRLDTSGNPVVAWLEGSGAVAVARWSGTGWTRLGGALANSGGTITAGQALALGDNGDPTVAWRVSNQGYVSRWTGSSWSLLGGPVHGGAAVDHLAVVAAKPAVIGYQSGSQVFVERWDTTANAWTSVAAPRTITGYNGVAFLDSVALDPTGGNPVISWRALEDSSSLDWALYVEQSSGGTWNALGGMLNVDVTWGAWASLVQVDGTGAVTAAWNETQFRQPRHVYVKRYAGGAWTQLGGRLNDGSVEGSEALALDIAGRPVVAFSQNVASQVDHLVAKVWDGAGWQAIGGNVDNVAGDVPGPDVPSLAVNASNLLALSWLGLRNADPADPASRLAYSVYVSTLGASPSTSTTTSTSTSTSTTTSSSTTTTTITTTTSTTTTTLPAGTPDASLAMTKSGTFASGGTGKFILTAKNVGTASTSRFTVADTLPPGLNYDNKSGTGWTCTNAGQTVTCTYKNAVAPGAAAPTLTISIWTMNRTRGQFTNAATVAAPGDANTANNSASLTVTVA